MKKKMNNETEAKLAEGMPTDRTKYYDASQFGLGIGTIIPAAEPDEFDGRSTAFDHNKPLKVIVDSYRGDAFEVDMSKVNDKAIGKAISATDNLSERLRIIANEIDGKRKEEDEEK